MSPPLYFTRAELSLRRLEALKRPLTDEESDELRRALHAVYCRNRRIQAEQEAGAAVLAEFNQDNAETLDRMLREALS